jgi:hypothetical protein
MKQFLMILMMVLVPFPAQSGVSSYFCEINATYELSKNGELKPWHMTSHLQRQPFSIDRTTGQITSEFHKNHDPKVLWNPRPGDGNSFIVTDSATMGVSARISSIVVQEWVESDEKPFIWYWVTNVLVGVCR